MGAYGTPDLQSPSSGPPQGPKKRIGSLWIIAIILIAIIILAGATGMGWATSFSAFGFIGILIYLCSLIVAAIRKKDKNPSGIGVAGSAVIFIIGIVLSSHSGATSAVKAPSMSVSEASIQSQIQSQPESAVSEVEKSSFKVGETAKYNDVELTVTKVVKSKGGEFDNPKSGDEYVVVTVKYKNDGEENISYNPYDFKIKNSKGQITSGTFASSVTKNELNSGALAPGGEVEGDVIFEAPKGDNGLVLQYTGNIFLSNSQVDFQLQ